ncbi:hypothetical protein BJX66DRAFT_170601 [Aspergillus keveii]|uniref:Nucleoside phosphorylase domain-containing protein n=1 Tax=Aspergillus keveii TaxID=714993 RepID=A0ABR4FHF7_9EURO
MASNFENVAYTVGWICADHMGFATARAMLDAQHGRPQTQHGLDDNTYTLGRIGPHNVVITCLSLGGRGTVGAALAASRLISSFPIIRFGLLVGTGGGIPTDEYDIRLGDVAVSAPNQTFGGVVQIDFGKATPRGFERTGSLNKPPRALMTAIQDVRANHFMGNSQTSRYLNELCAANTITADAYTYPGVQNDKFFSPDSLHQDPSRKSCTKCTGIKRRSRRKDTAPVIHYGTIASGNKIIRTA